MEKPSTLLSLKNASITYKEKFAKGFSVWLTGGYAERAPSTTEQFAFYIFNAYDGYNYIGKNNLKTEKAIQGDVGFQWKHKKIAVRATGFYYHMPDYILSNTDSTIDAMTIGAHGVKVAQNISFAQLAGGTMEVEFFPIKNITLKTMGTYTYGRTNDGNPLPLIPPFKNVSSVKWSYKRGSVLLDCESAAQQLRINAAFGETTSASYATLNLRASYFFIFF